MTIIGLKTVDNGTQGLSPAHSHPNFYPRTRPVRTSPPVFSSSCPLRQNHSLVSSLLASNFPELLPNCCGTVMSLQQTLTNTHTHTRSLIISASADSHPFSSICVLSKSFDLCRHRDKSRVPANSGSDVTDALVHGARWRTHTSSRTAREVREMIMTFH